MMVVVPTFPSGDHGDDHRVPAGVRGGVAPPADEVGHRVHQERPVPQQHRGEEEPDQQAAPPSDQQAGDGQHPRTDPLEPLEQAQLRKGGEVLDGREIGRLVLGGQDPAHVAPPEPVTRRVDVVVLIAEAVVQSVVAGPPEGALLQGGGPAERHEELGHPAHPVAAVGEVPVVSGGDAEHPGEVEHGAQHPVLPGDHDEERGQRGDVHGEERDGRHPVGPIDGPVRAGGVRGVGGLGEGGVHGRGPSPVGEGSQIVTERSPGRGVRRPLGSIRRSLTSGRRGPRSNP